MSETEYTSVSLTKQQKRELDDLCPDGMTRGTFVMEAVRSHVDGTDTDTDAAAEVMDVDIDALAERIEASVDADFSLEELRKVVASEAEQGSYRGATDAIESNLR